MNIQINPLIGKTVEEAEKLAYPDIIRVVKKDGKFVGSTCDYQINRINVCIEDGIITQIDGYG